VLDVIVIGGGPAGSQTAYRLASRGRSVAVVEKREGIGQKPCCTGIISQECVAAFEIPSRVILKQTHSAVIFSPSGESIKVSRPETRVCIVDRPELDRALAEKAQAAGAVYYLNSPVKTVSARPDRIIVKLEKGGSQQLEARCAVLATGFGSPLVEELGFGRVKYFAVGAQATVELNEADEIEVYLSQLLAPGFFGWLVPTSPGNGVVGLLTHRNPGVKLQELLEHSKSSGKVKPGNYAIKYGGIPLKPLARTRGERLLVVGDAAGQVKPTTGGGLYFGLICADIAAETIHNAIEKGDLSARSLLLYEKEWRKKLGHELRVEYFVRRCYEHLSDRQINRIFERIDRSGIASSLLQNDQIAFDWHGGLLLKALRMGIVSEIKRSLHLN
jgi:digeranylgeranylglycerophospholipid reductase